MAFTKVNYEDVEQVSSAMHFLSEPLETEQVGVTIVRCDPEWRSQPHDHRDNAHEEVYILIDGAATVVVDDETIDMKAGDALWISPESTRQIRNGAEESAFVLVSAPSLTQDESTNAEWLLTGFAG